MFGPLKSLVMDPPVRTDKSKIFPLHKFITMGSPVAFGTFSRQDMVKEFQMRLVVQFSEMLTESHRISHEQNHSTKL